MVEGDGAVLSVCVCVRDMPSPIAVRVSGYSGGYALILKQRYREDDILTMTYACCA